MTLYRLLCCSLHSGFISSVDTIKKSTSHVTMATNSSHWVRSGRLRREPPDRRSAHLMMEGDRNVVDAYFSTLIDADSEDSDDEYVPREEWRQVCAAVRKRHDWE